MSSALGSMPLKFTTKPNVSGSTNKGDAVNEKVTEKVGFIPALDYSKYEDIRFVRRENGALRQGVINRYSDLKEALRAGGLNQDQDLRELKSLVTRLEKINFKDPEDTQMVQKMRNKLDGFSQEMASTYTSNTENLGDLLNKSGLHITTVESKSTKPLEETKLMPVRLIGFKDIPQGTWSAKPDSTGSFSEGSTLTYLNTVLTVNDEVGSGKWGKVYKVTDSDGKVSALKVIDTSEMSLKFKRLFCLLMVKQESF